MAEYMCALGEEHTWQCERQLASTPSARAAAGVWGSRRAVGTAHMLPSMTRAATFCRRPLPSLRPSATSLQPCAGYEYPQSLHVGKEYQLFKTSKVPLFIIFLAQEWWSELILLGWKGRRGCSPRSSCVRSSGQGVWQLHCRERWPPGAARACTPRGLPSCQRNPARPCELGAAGAWLLRCAAA